MLVNGLTIKNGSLLCVNPPMKSNEEVWSTYLFEMMKNCLVNNLSNTNLIEMS